MPTNQGMNQLCQNMNFGASNNNNFSMMNVLGSHITELESCPTIAQSSNLSQMESNIHITPIVNQSIDNLQLQQQQQLQRNILNMNVDIAITSTNS